MRSCVRCWRQCLLLLLFLSVGVHQVHSFGIWPSLGRSTAAIHHATADENNDTVDKVPRGGWSIIPAGWNLFGYKVTKLGQEFLGTGDALSCDVGRFLASLKAHRKRRKAIKEQWLEILRASKTGQSMRIYRDLDKLLDFCLRAGLIN